MDVKNTNRLTKKRIISFMMSIILFVTMIPSNAFATGVDEEVGSGTEEATVSEENEELSLEETLQLEESLSEENAIPEESTESATVFDLGDGKKTIVYYGQDVRFEEEGELVDYDPALVTVDETKSDGGESLKGYKFENKVGDSKHYIPDKLQEDSQILMEKDDYSIKMMPLDESIKECEVVLEKEETLTPYETVEEKRTVAVYEALDKSHAYEYTSLNQGIKESIILNEKPESNVFKFSLELKGLYAELNEEENTILLKEKSKSGTTDEVIAVVDRPFMNDASGEAYSEELTYSLEEIEDGYYLITLTVSKKYLNSAERIYPITIDPTMTWKGSEAFLDVYVLNGSYADINFYDEDTRVMPVGIGSKGTYRTYFKLPNIKSKLADKYIDSAYLTVYETGKCDADQTIRINRITESWTTTTLTWNNKPSYYTVTYNNQFTTDGTQYQAHKISLTAAVRNFINSTDNPNYGFVMRNVTSDPEYAEFYGSRVATSTYRPKFVVTYYDKPTKASSIYTTRLTNGSYVRSNYIKQGNRIYANWEGINSHNLSAVQYKFTGINGTAQPTSVSADAVDLTSYRSTGSATASGANVGLSYSPSLPTGVYRLYIRGKDVAGMFGTARYMTVYVDGAAPSLTNVVVTPATTETSVTSNGTPKVSWNATDTYFSKVTISVDGKTAKTVSTTVGEGSYTIPAGTIATSGTHTIKITVYDKAGRTTSKTLNYHVDMDAPEIAEMIITPETEDDKSSNVKTPEVQWTIASEDLEQVEVLLDETSIYTTEDPEVTSYKFTADRFDTSGSYRITVKATDTSGNVSSVEQFYYLDVDVPVFESLAITPETTEIITSGNRSPILDWEIKDIALASVSYSLDGTNYEDMGSSKTGSFTLPSSVWTAESGEFTIYVKAKDVAGNESPVSELSYHLGASSDFIPKELTVTEYYGKHILRWQLDAYDGEKAAYDLHRGEEASFTPNEDTLVEADIDAAKSIFIDKEILEKDTYYYKIVVRDLTENQNVPDGYSEEVTVENTVTKEQFANTLGQRSYLSYLDVGLPMGNLSVEESSGNVIYSQSEFSVSNAQLSYGLERTYNSLNERTSMFGTGWTDSWHKELYTDGTDMYFVDTDGSSYRFALNNGVYSCEETKEYELDVTETGYEIFTKGDQLFTFNTEGQLIRISEPNGCEISYCYDGMGRLAYVISKEDKDGERKLTLEYEEDGYLLNSVEDFVGTVYQYTYSGNNLTKVSIGPKDNVTSGVSYNYSYGENKLLVGITDGMSNLYSITYSDKKAASVDYPDGEKFTLTYSDSNTTIEKYTPSQKKIHTEKITFDSLTGKLLVYEDAKGNETSYEYVEESPYLVAKLKNVKAYQSINENQEVVFHETENVVETEYTYDENENVTEEISSDGSETTYTYDENDDVIAEQTVKDGEVSVDITYVYDDQGNVIRTEDQIEDTIETNAYEDGNLISTSVTNTDVQEIPEEVESTDDDNSEGIVATASETTEDTAVSNSDAASTAVYEYDSQGNVTSEKTVAGVVKTETQITYDQMGRVLTSVENGVTTVTEYDFLGREIQTTIKEDNKADVVTTKTYYANSSLASESSTTGVTKSYTYDNRNRLLTTTTTGNDIETNIVRNTYGYEEKLTIKNAVETVTEEMVYKEEVKDTAGMVTSITYNDVLGRMVKEVVGTTYTDYRYDVSGNCISSYEGSTESEEYLLSITLYDEEGRSFAEIIAPQVSDGIYVISEQSVVTYTEYDTSGNVSKETDALGIITTYKHDEEGKLTETDIAADGTDISVVYYTLANGDELIEVKDAKGNVKKELLNAAGLTAQTIDEDSESTDTICTTGTYDDFGRKTKDIFSDDTYITYSYDGESERVTEKEEYLKDGTRESSTTYTYNDQNQLIGIIHKEGDTEVAAYTYTYDVSGRVLTESVSYDSETAKTTSYEYDAEGRLVETAYPEGNGIGTITYEYDSYGKLLKIKRDNNVIREYVYDSFNRVASIKDFDKPGNSSYTLKTYAYDEFGRTISMVYTEDGDTSKVLENYTYSYDKNDNIVSETRISNLPAEDSMINETRDYEYDSYGRLVKSIITDHTADDTEVVTTYEYDAVGNRVKQTEDGAVTTYEYNGLNQLEKAETETEEVLYAYDARGNQISESNSTTGEVVETVYNVAGEMVSLQKKSNDVVTFTQTNIYNQDGSRISKTQGETEREYYYNNGIVAFTEDDDTVSSSNIQNADGNVIGTYRGDTYYNYFKNLQGSTASIVSEIGDIAVVYTYGDFGETEEVVTDTIDNEICYTGAICDKDTGLYCMNARYYNAETGRFISQDSYRGEAEDAGTWHLYAYCANNPVNFVDPTGHAIETVLDIASLGYSVAQFVSKPSWRTVGSLLWDVGATFIPFLPGSYVKNGAKITLKVADKVSDFKKGRKTCLTVGKYKALCKAIPNRRWRRIEIHHIIEKRFGLLDIPLNDYPSIPINKSLHNKITKRWSKVIKKRRKGSSYKDISKKELLQAARTVYHDMPELKNVATQIINKYYK